MGPGRSKSPEIGGLIVRWSAPALPVVARAPPLPPRPKNCLTVTSCLPRWAGTFTELAATFSQAASPFAPVGFFEELAEKNPCLTRICGYLYIAAKSDQTSRN